MDLNQLKSKIFFLFLTENFILDHKKSIKKFWRAKNTHIENNSKKKR
jgi:hypothetical protein